MEHLLCIILPLCCIFIAYRLGGWFMRKRLLEVTSERYRALHKEYDDTCEELAKSRKDIELLLDVIGEEIERQNNG